jgi:hypothetical protein
LCAPCFRWINRETGAASIANAVLCIAAESTAAIYTIYQLLLLYVQVHI